MKILGLIPLVHGLWCWDGNSTKMQALQCSGSCQLADNCAGKAPIARCSNNSCPLVVGSCEMCCKNDYCNSKHFSNLELEDVTVSSLPINSIRYGIAGRSVANDLCATLVLVEPKPDDCISEADSGAYLTLKQGVRSCAWDSGAFGLSNQDHQLTALSGCWKGLGGPQPEIFLNATARSPLFSGTLRFASASKPQKPQDQAPTYKVEEERMRKQPSSVRHFNQKNPVIDNKAKSRIRPRFTVATKHSADEVKVSPTNSLTVRISSPSGIGSATLTKVNGRWPRVKHVLLDLRGLEDFQVSNGNVTLHASVSRDAVLGWSDEIGEPLPRKWHMPIAVISSNGTVIPHYSLPLPEDQLFRVALPNALCPSSVSTLQLAWIDFYR